MKEIISSHSSHLPQNFRQFPIIPWLCESLDFAMLISQYKTTNLQSITLKKREARNLAKYQFFFSRLDRIKFL